MDSGQVLYYLDIWREYMQSMDSHKLGYPSKSAGFMSGGIHSVDDLEDSIDVETARAVESAVDSLPPMEQDAIYVVFLGQKSMVNKDIMERAYNTAISKLGTLLSDRGLY